MLNETGGHVKSVAAGVPNTADQQREMLRDMPDGRILFNPVTRNGAVMNSEPPLNSTLDGQQNGLTHAQKASTAVPGAF